MQRRQDVLAAALLSTSLLLDCNHDSVRNDMGLSGRMDGGGTGIDAGVLDGGSNDAGSPDGGSNDAGTSDGGVNDWTFYRYDVEGHSDVEVQLTTTEAATLSKVWAYQHAEASYSNPIVANGVVYQAWADGTLKAIDLKTGSELWHSSIGILGPSGCVSSWAAPIGAPAVVGDTVFAPGGDGSVYALDRQTGQQIWKTPVAMNALNEFLWTSVFPLAGKVYVGVATQDEGVCTITAMGRAVALDQASGQIVATWWVTNQMPGGGIWTQPVFDAHSNRMFYTTGNSVATAGPEPDAQAVVAVDPDTLQVVDSYQVVTNNGSDDDFGASPTLIDLPGGQHLVIATNKNCVVSALDRDHLSQGLVWTFPMCVAGTSPDDGLGSIVSAAYAHGRLFVAGGQTPDGYPGIVAALDPSTGTPTWTMHPDGFVLPALLAVGDVLFACASHTADMTGRLYVLDQASGSTVLTCATPGELFAPPSFAEGTLLLPDTAGNLFAYRTAP